MKRVGVIGAGAAGLCAARHILNFGLVPIVWEKSVEIGGTWVHTPNTGCDENGLPIHSSMYDSLKTNLPKEIMNFPDYPFSKSLDSFMHHKEVLDYLKSYAKHFEVIDKINFSHHVECVEPVEEGNEHTSWQVSVRNLVTGDLSHVDCDAVIICNGHFSVPEDPEIPNLSTFKGTVLHSHDYREPSIFEDQTVVILGAGPSGTDISLDVATVAGKVYLSHNGPLLHCQLPNNIQQVSGIKDVLNGRLLLKDGSIIDTDALLLCNGYAYRFPFLASSCGISTDQHNIVWPLYKHMINCKYPTMAFIGIPTIICAFPLFDFQIRYFLTSLMGDFTLPKNMEEIIQKQYQKHILDFPARHFHVLDELQWSYFDGLAREAVFEPLPETVAHIFKYVAANRDDNLTGYKNMKIQVLDANVYEDTI